MVYINKGFSKTLILMALITFFVGQVGAMTGEKYIRPAAETQKRTPEEYVRQLEESGGAASLKTKKDLEAARKQLEAQTRELEVSKKTSENEVTKKQGEVAELYATLRRKVDQGDQPRLEEIIKKHSEGKTLSLEEMALVRKLLDNNTQQVRRFEDLPEEIAGAKRTLDTTSRSAEEVQKRIADQTNAIAEQMKRYAGKLGAARSAAETAQEVGGKLKEVITGKKAGEAVSATALIKRGGIALAGGAVLLGLVMEIIQELGQEFGDLGEQFKGVKEQWDKSFKDVKDAFVEPNPNQTAPEGDVDYNKTLGDVAALFTDVDKDFKYALEKCKYTDKKFRISVGKVNDIDVFIEYDFEQIGAGDVGLPFTPFMVTLSPQQINGYAVTPDDLLGKLDEGDAKDLTALLLQPSAALIFMIKFIQLANSTLSGSSKDYSEKIDSIIDETTELFSRLSLTEEDLTPAQLLESMPQPIQDVLSEKKIRVYSSFVKMMDEPAEEQRTALVEKMIEFGSIFDFDTKLKFIEENVLSDVNKNLSLNDKALFTYLIEFVASGMVDDLKNATDRVEKIKSRSDALLSLIDKSKTAMEAADFDADQLKKMTTLETSLSNIKSNPARFNIKKPEFGDVKFEYQENTLAGSLDVFYNIYQRITTKKLDIDSDYFDIGILNYGKRYTKYNLQSILYSCLSYLKKAEEEIVKTEGTITLKGFNGKEYTANPTADLESMINKPTEAIDAVKDTIKSAIKNISSALEAAKGAASVIKDKDFKSAQDAYTKAVSSAKGIINTVATAKMKFRRKYAPFFATSMPDGSSKTVAEILISNMQILKKHSVYVDKLIPAAYAPFSKHLGFTEKQLLSIVPVKEEPVEVSTDTEKQQPKKTEEAKKEEPVETPDATLTDVEKQQQETTKVSPVAAEKASEDVTEEQPVPVL